MDNVSAKTVLIGVSVVVTTTAIVWLKSKKDNMTKAREVPPFQMPMAPGANWLLGHVRAITSGDGFEGHKRVFHDFADTNGMSCYWWVNEPAISVLSGKDAKAVFNASSSKPSFSYIDNHLQQFVGKKSILVLQAKEWKLHRSAIHRSFTPAALQQSQNAINNVGNTLAESLLLAIDNSNDQCLHRAVLPLMKMATMDVFGSTFLGVDFQSCTKLKLPQFANSFEFMGAEFQRRLQSPFDLTAHRYSLPTKANREHARHRNFVRSYMTEHIAAAQQRLQDGSAMKQDLLTNILKAAAESKGTDVTTDVVVDMFVTLLFAGDTTSISLAYAIDLLAKNRAVQETCLKEIESVMGGADHPESLVSPDALPYTKAVVLEALRIYSPVTLGSRVLEKEMTLHDHILPKGTRVALPIWLIQRHEMNYPSPLEMRPDRWVRGSSNKNGNGSCWEERPLDDAESSDIAPANRDAFLAFSGGARNCVGKNLAMREAVTLIAFLIRKIKFELVEDSYEVTHKMKLLHEPDDGLPMIIKRRKSVT